MPRSLTGLVSLTLLLACTGMESLPAAASLRCLAKSPSLTDARALRSAVRHEAGKIASALRMTDFCRHSDSGYADLQSPVSPGSEGAQEWWTLQCRRSSYVMQGQWSCDAPDRHRRIELRAIFGGVSRAIDVEFGDSVPVTTARDLG
jgi:hypothetical protein